jgi:hypothetical protein
MKFITSLLNPSFITIFPIQNASLDLILSQFNHVHTATRYLLYLIHCFMDAVSSPGSTSGLPNGKMTGNVTVIVASFVAEIRPRAGQTAVRTLAEARYFSLPQNVQTGSGTHHTPYSTSPGVLARGKTGMGRKLTTHLHLVPRLRKVKLYSCYPRMSLRRGRDNFTEA